MIGAGLGFLVGAICLLLSPAFYYLGSTFQPQPVSDIFLLFIVFFSGAVIEEVMYRGVLQRLLSSFLPLWLATTIQILVFIYSHEVNFLNTPDHWLSIASLACSGLFLTLLSFRSSYLVLPIFFHTAANFSLNLFRGQSELRLPLQFEIWNFGHLLAYEYNPIIVGSYCLLFLYFFGWRGQNKKDAK